MAKGKDARARVRVVLECTSWVRNGNGNGINNKNKKKESSGISRYITQKNRHNTSSYQIILNNNIFFFIHGGKV